MWFTGEKVFTVATPKNPQNDHVYTLLQRQREGTLQRIGCCALGQLSQSPSCYLLVCLSWVEPTSYSWTLASKIQNKWSILLGSAAETGDAARYPCNIWKLLHFSAGQCSGP